jgi:hypothetical protein
MLKFQAQVYRINDIAGWHDRRELRLAPEFQRRKVWSPRGKSFLIDSILRGMPLPQFFIREIVLPREKRTVREVVDGQQRLSTILGYIAGDFHVLPMHSTEYGRLKFDDLPDAAQRQFLSFPLSVNILEGTDDPDVLEIFSRINSYSVPLNEQEKLNALFVGAFKQAMNELAKEHLAYWLRNHILTTQPVARMRDLELTAELVAAMLLGLQNQKKVIRTLYKQYDDDFPQFRYIRPRFGETLQLCEDLLGGAIAATIFSRTSLFYSLFCAVYDATYGLGSNENAIRTQLTDEGKLFSQQRLLELSAALGDDERIPDEHLDFYEATRQSTDKLAQREARHRKLMSIFKAALAM